VSIIHKNLGMNAYIQTCCLNVMPLFLLVIFTQVILIFIIYFNKSSYILQHQYIIVPLRIATIIFTLINSRVWRYKCRSCNVYLSTTCYPNETRPWSLVEHGDDFNQPFFLAWRNSSFFGRKERRERDQKKEAPIFFACIIGES